MGGDRQVVERVLVEHGQVGAEGLAEHTLQPAGRQQGARAAPRLEALDQAEVVLGHPDDFADANLGCRALQPEPAPVATSRSDEAMLHQPLRHLHQVVARNAVALRHLLDGRKPVGLDREIHQEP